MSFHPFRPSTIQVKEAFKFSPPIWSSLTNLAIYSETHIPFFPTQNGLTYIYILFLINIFSAAYAVKFSRFLSIHRLGCHICLVTTILLRCSCRMSMNITTYGNLIINFSTYCCSHAFKFLYLYHLCWFHLLCLLVIHLLLHTVFFFFAFCLYVLWHTWNQNKHNGRIW